MLTNGNKYTCTNLVLPYLGDFMCSLAGRACLIKSKLLNIDPLLLCPVTPAKLRPFEVDATGPTDQEWMVWSVDNTNVNVSWLGDVHTQAHIQVSDH